MKKTVFKDNEVKKMVLGAVVAIFVCTFLFTGFSKAGKLAIYKDTKTVPTNYNIDLIKGSINSNVPEGYVKPNYKVELIDLPDKPTEKDMSMQEAAELGAQNLWRLFGVNLSNQTIYMDYDPSDCMLSCATWHGEVNIDNVGIYNFQLDAVTGEYYYTSAWDYSKDHLSLKPIKNYREFASLAEKTAEKYQLVSGKIISSKCDAPRYVGTNPVIDVRVKSENGQESELTFRDNKELWFVAYNRYVKQQDINLAKANGEEAQAENKTTENNAANTVE